MININGTGRIAVQVTGHGPLVLCVPGMGESRSSFRHLIPGLVDAGYRVAAMDLRGHGDSSAEFPLYDDPATAHDILSVIAELGGPATVIGNSMGAAAAVIAAAEDPEAVNGLVLIGPFVRDHGPAAVKAAMRLLLMKPWGPAMWSRYHRSLFGDVVPADHGEHLREVSDLLGRPGRWKAFQRTALTSHAPAEAALPDVTAPVSVIMGSADPDFRDPEEEARWIATKLGGDFSVIPGAGHYPMAEQPEITLSVILPFLEETIHG